METLGGLDVQPTGSENDFNDLSLLIYGLSYAHSLAAVDGWVGKLFSMARNRFAVFAQHAGDLESHGNVLEGIRSTSYCPHGAA